MFYLQLPVQIESALPLMRAPLLSRFWRYWKKQAHFGGGKKSGHGFLLHEGLFEDGYEEPDVHWGNSANTIREMQSVSLLD